MIRLLGARGSADVMAVSIVRQELVAAGLRAASFVVLTLL